MKPTTTKSPKNGNLSLTKAIQPRTIAISFAAAEAHEVFVAGDFNQWNPKGTPLNKDARAADIIVVATHAGWELTEAFKDWISRWLSTKTERPTTLALVLDARQSRDRDGRGVAFHLAEVARLGGVDFITSEGGQPAADIEGPLTQILTQRNRSTSLALQMT